ncbi:hypothetical protein [Streptomyces sp. NBC_01235]|uniref:hypothetical protein n=1 Tax=Streptomyces sp. NBC_01235 TaxID=2903788 RepID=UPI002E130073|nr:hypothetical protein OG289_02510 [Streptomyces sp. NBC_01235]
MILLPPRVRVPTVAAPFLFLLYGALRLVDGLGGEHGPGFVRNVGTPWSSSVS